MLFVACFFVLGKCMLQGCNMHAALAIAGNEVFIDFSLLCSNLLPETKDIFAGVLMIQIRQKAVYESCIPGFN